MENNLIDRNVELKNCTGIKTILMMIIVLFHSMAIYMEGGWGPYVPEDQSVVFCYLADWFSTFHVYAFALISGYIFYHIKYERGGVSEISSICIK